ncbi:unnamed protein product [Orchesella dallaii]|uniref:C2H2-type domain-containing protein n=1 Tax=Orchesella dallaii TaxID=48710 RepID=A0ABP1RX20_9HEXA
MDDESKYFYPCYKCDGKKFEDIIKHQYEKHFYVKTCPFCKDVEFESGNQRTRHVNAKHRIQTGLYEPSVPLERNPVLDKLNYKQELEELRGTQTWKVVVKENYGVLYDEEKHTPIVCIEQLTVDDLTNNIGDKTQKYYTDGELDFNVCPLGFTRMKPPMEAGHLAARANHVKSEAAVAETFSTVNVVPMDSQVNRGVWNKIEENARKLVWKWNDIIILSGPIYSFNSSNAQVNISGLPIFAPESFFKIIIMRRNGEDPKLQAFIVNNFREITSAFHQRATLEEIGTRTGLNLLKYTKYVYTWNLKDKPILCADLIGYATSASPPPVASVPVKKSVDDFGVALNDPFSSQLPDMEGGPPSSSRTRRRKTFNEVIRIPVALVGLIIGGEQVSRIQAETGCNVQVDPNSGGGKDRPCYLQGTKEAIERAKNLITDIVSSKSHEIGRLSSEPAPPKPINGQSFMEMVIPGPKVPGGEEGGIGDGGGGLSSSKAGLETMRFPVSKVSVGLIIGKGGELIKRIQMETGAKVQFHPINCNFGDVDEQSASITGKPDQARQAQLRLQELVETALHGGKGDNPGERRGESGGGSGHNRPRDYVDERLEVPVGRVGMEIGNGGETVRSINQQPSAALVNVDEESKYWFPCYDCGGKKFKDLIRHRYEKHNFIKECPFCTSVEFASCGRVAEHIRRKHRIQTGLWEPAATVVRNPDLEKLNFQQELEEMKQSQDWKIVVKEKYGVLYDESMHTPIVCIEHLTATNLQKNFRADDARFYQDGLLEKNVCPKGFPSMKPPMHAGHLAARANHTNSEEAFLETFSMVNVVPMDSHVNISVWAQIENHSRRLLSNWHDVIVFSGPIYDFGSSIPQINPVGLPIYAPTEFFKLLVMRRNMEEPKIQCFIVENNYKTTELFHHRARAEDIATKTGLNLSKYEKYAYTWDLKNEQFICNKRSCYKTFLSQKDLDVHKLVPHCSVCGHIFAKESDLTTHKESHPNLPCPVPNCTFECKRKYELTGHNHQVHGTERPFSCVVQGCSLKYKTKSQLNSHIKGAHNDERPYGCPDPECSKSFKMKNNLDVHVKGVHNAEQRPFLCEYPGCTKAFLLKGHLTDHVKTVHSNERKFICHFENCNKKYKKNASLQRHVKKSHGGKLPPEAEKTKTSNGTRSGKATSSLCVKKKDARSGVLKRKCIDESNEDD